MLRRRSLMDMQAPAQDWDVVWDYTMGFPEDNGFEKLIDKSPLIEMTENGLSIHITDNGYVRYVPSGYETCNEGIYEEIISFSSLPVVNGNRMILSDGSEGLQIYIRRYDSVNLGIVYNDKIIIWKLNYDEEYTVRIEKFSDMNIVYLNGEEIYRSDVLSTAYATGNKIFFQSGGEYLLKSIKFKKIS